jgi:excisionase family DNA binding protein
MSEIRDQVGRSGRFLTSAEVAAHVGVSPRTVSNWIRDGHLKAYRTPGGHGRVAEEDLQRFLDERGIHPLPAAPDHSHDRPAVQPRTRVLFIDDDENLLDIVREVLEANGFEVQTARHGFLAGYLVAHFQPNVIVLDIMMPGLDGFEVMSLLRKRPEARDVPVIACTSLRGTDAEARAQEAGFVNYLKKPLDFRGLVALLREVAP